MKYIEAALVAERKVEALVGAEGVDDIEGVLADGVVEGRVAVRILEVDVAAVTQERSHALRVLLVHGHVEGAALAVVHRVDGCASGQQQLHYIRLVPERTSKRELVEGLSLLDELDRQFLIGQGLLLLRPALSLVIL
jgi:hypothetical protein